MIYEEEIIMNTQKHLTLESRNIIEIELGKGTSFRKIARILHKDPTTISKEIRAHIRHEKTGAFSKSFNDCLHNANRSCSLRNVCKMCTYRKRLCWSCGICNEKCSLYEKYTCPKLKKPPYVCNSCESKTNCTLEKSFYKALSAQKEYETLLSESRSGFAFSEEEIRHLDNIVSPLLIKGQSIHHISIFHKDEVMMSERTLYSYVNNGIFSARNIDMPRTVRMRPRKSKTRPLKVDKSCRINRTFKDYKDYMSNHSDLPAQQIDSVIGIKGGPVLLTIHFVKQELQLAFLRESNDSKSVTDIFNNLYSKLGSDAYSDLFPILLADNGSEFSNPTAIEFDKEGKLRSRVFYCDANAPFQKPNCENNHEFIRRIIPKGVDFGKYTQKDIDIMMSHINSYARESLGNKSPYEVFAFQYGEELLDIFNIKKISADEITLTEKLFSKADK